MPTFTTLKRFKAKQIYYSLRTAADLVQMVAFVPDVSDISTAVVHFEEAAKLGPSSHLHAW